MDNIERIHAAKRSIEDLKKRIKDAKATKQNGKIPDAVAARGALSGSGSGLRLAKRRELTGHFGKVYASHWAGDSVHLVSASQDGKMIVWNALNTFKVQSITLKVSWVMTCAFEQTRNSTVASGGLDNACTIYGVGGESTGRRAGKELVGHEGYISCCRFITDKTILTSSGDGTAAYWDIEKGIQVTKFIGHGADVLSLSEEPNSKSTFATSSCDMSVKIWDLRSGKCTQSFTGHDSDVNSVAFFPDGFAVGTGSDDATCRVFDLRCSGEVNCLGNDKVACGVTCVQFSKSGRYLFGGYEDGICRVWDITKGRTPPICTLTGHENRVSSVSVNPRGDALSTSSWDSMVRIWA